MNTQQAMAIVGGQRAALRWRLEQAIVWMRLMQFCRRKATSYLASAGQSAELAEQAIRAYARAAPPVNDAFDRAVAGVASRLDERDAGLRESA